MTDFWTAALPALGVLTGIGIKSAIDLALEGRRWRREDRLRDREEKRAAYRKGFVLLLALAHDKRAIAEPDVSDDAREISERLHREAQSLMVALQFLAPTSVTAAYLKAVGDDGEGPSTDRFLAEARLDLGQRRRRESIALPSVADLS